MDGRCSAERNGMSVVRVELRVKGEPAPALEDSGPVQQRSSDARQAARSRCSVRAWPIMMTGVVLVSGMAFMVWWPTLFEDKHGWQTSADMWGIFRAAHYVGWGFLGGVYDPSTGVNSPPGMEVLLAPVAMLSGHLGLTESFSPYFIPRPTAALLLEPVELLLASTVLFAVDALAGHLGLGRPRRICLCIATTVLVWPTAAVWGHAEDCLSLALAMYALIAALKGRWAACGWLFAFALVIQPFVVMVLPIVVAASPAGQRMLIVVRSFSLTALFVGAAFASDAANAYRALVLQPTPPTVNHPTPWISLAPRLFQAPPVVAQRAVITYRSGKFVEHVARGEFHSVALVSGGAGRAIETVLAVFIGLYVWRRPQSADRFVWLAAVCLGMRCLFEAVMLPYYLGSPLILLVAVTSLQS